MMEFKNDAILTAAAGAAAARPPPPSAAAAAAAAVPVKNAADARYSFDDTKLAKLRTDSPWMKETKYFTSVAISPSAIMKMVRWKSLSYVYLSYVLVCFEVR
jgi:hypothetical protein